MARPDYSGARWYGAYHGNYMRANRPSSNRINKVVIHVVQGSFSSAINWFNDSRAGVSAHYTVRSSDGFIGQSVEEKDIAYHAGNWPVNQNAIGIEHEGYGDQPTRWFTPALYNSSARLTAHLCKKYGIPVQLAGGPSGAGILAHRQATSTACPGQFNFNHYMNLVRGYVGGMNNQPRTYVQVVDNTTPGRFRASGNWKVSSYSPQKFGADYRYAVPGPRPDPARFRVRTPRRGRYAFFARWPASAGYHPRVRINIRTANGVVQRVVNQQRNGGRWVRLGLFEMPAQDGWVVHITRAGRGRKYVIADAVRVVER